MQIVLKNDSEPGSETKCLLAKKKTWKSQDSDYRIVITEARDFNTSDDGITRYLYEEFEGEKLIYSHFISPENVRNHYSWFFLD